MTYLISGKSKEMWGCLSALSRKAKRIRARGLFQGTVVSLISLWRSRNVIIAVDLVLLCVGGSWHYSTSVYQTAV